MRLSADCTKRPQVKTEGLYSVPLSSLLFSECVLFVPFCPLLFSSQCPLTCVQFRVDVFSRPKIGKRKQIAFIYKRATKSWIVNKQAEICFSRISQPSNLLLWIFFMPPCSWTCLIVVNLKCSSRIVLNENCGIVWIYEMHISDTRIVVLPTKYHCQHWPWIDVTHNLYFSKST